jgi:hypothetical protein
MVDMPPVSDLPALLRALQPVLHPGVYIFTTVHSLAELDPAGVIASIQEDEGVSVILPEADAARHGLAGEFRCAWITLAVNSDLAAVGLTAAFTKALAAAGIGCNVVAGRRHDHLFVPVEQAGQAMGVLQALAQTGPGDSTVEND